MKTIQKNHWLLLRPISHRGLHGINKDGEFIPENSIPSFQRAIDQNYSIEIDLQLTKDEEVIVFHDKDFSRICGKNILVKNGEFEQIKKFKLFKTDCNIPSFLEVLEFVKGQVPLVIELKSDIFPGILELKVFEMLIEYEGKYHGNFSIQSFQPGTIIWFQRKNVKYPLGLIGGNKKINIFSFKSLMIEYFGYVTLIRPDYIAYQHKKIIRYKWLSLVRKYLKIPVIGWTIKSKQEYAIVANRVDNIIFEKYEA